MLTAVVLIHSRPMTCRSTPDTRTPATSSSTAKSTFWTIVESVIPSVARKTISEPTITSPITTPATVAPATPSRMPR